MGRIATEMVRDAHAYTRSKTPWLLDAFQDGVPDEGAKEGRGARWRLFRDLSGGGMKTFGRTIAQEEAEARRTRVLAAAGVFAGVWLLLMLY